MVGAGTGTAGIGAGIVSGAPVCAHSCAAIPKLSPIDPVAMVFITVRFFVLNTNLVPMS